MTKRYSIHWTTFLLKGIPIRSEHYNNNEIQIDIHNPNKCEGDQLEISEAGIMSSPN
jgi:hypothetical protein